MELSSLPHHPESLWDSEISWTFHLCYVGPVCYNSWVFYLGMSTPWEKWLSWKFIILLNKLMRKITDTIWEPTHMLGQELDYENKICFKCPLNLVDIPRRSACILFSTPLIQQRSHSFLECVESVWLKAKHGTNSKPLHSYGFKSFYFQAKCEKWKKRKRMTNSVFRNNLIWSLELKASR